MKDRDAMTTISDANNLPADRPATEPLRMALQEVVDQLDDYGPNGPGFARSIEYARSTLAEAAQGAAPRPHITPEDMWDAWRESRPQEGDGRHMIRLAEAVNRHIHSEGAAPRAEGLDVDKSERIGQAIYDIVRYDLLDSISEADCARLAQRLIEGVRAALSRLSDERVPEEER